MKTPKPDPAPQRDARTFRALILGLVLLLAVLVWVGSNGRPGGGLPEAERNTKPARTGAAKPEEPRVGVRSGYVPPADPESKQGVNAADLYLRAATLYDALSETERKMITDPKAEVDEVEAEALFKKIQPIMELLKAGAQADYCEWGLGPVSLDTPLPQLATVSHLGKLALWSAAYRFPADPHAALDDLAILTSFGKALPEVAVGALVANMQGRLAVDVIRANAAFLDGPAIDQARRFLVASADPVNASAAVTHEFSILSSFMQRLADSRVAGGQASEVPLETSGDVARMETVLRDPRLLADERQFLEATGKQFAEAWRWNDARFQTWWAQVVAESKQHALTKEFLPAYSGIRLRILEEEAKRELLDVGLVVLQKGPAAITSDPALAARYRYVPKPGGVELQTRSELIGRDLTMEFVTAK